MNFDKYSHLTVEKEFSVAHSGKLNFYIICLYRPPGTNIPLFIDRLEQTLARLPLHASLILAGDFNIDYLDKASKNVHLLTNLLNSFALFMHVEVPTPITQTSATTLDYICSTFNHDGMNCDIVN